jgi:hypothetical protein
MCHWVKHGISRLLDYSYRVRGGRAMQGGHTLAADGGELRCQELEAMTARP